MWFARPLICDLLVFCRISLELDRYPSECRLHFMLYNVALGIRIRIDTELFVSNPDPGENEKKKRKKKNVFLFCFNFTENTVECSFKKKIAVG